MASCKPPESHTMRVAGAEWHWCPFSDRKQMARWGIKKEMKSAKEGQRRLLSSLFLSSFYFCSEEGVSWRLPTSCRDLFNSPLWLYCSRHLQAVLLASKTDGHRQKVSIKGILMLERSDLPAAARLERLLPSRTAACCSWPIIFCGEITSWPPHKQQSRIHIVLRTQ